MFQTEILWWWKNWCNYENHVSNSTEAERGQKAVERCEGFELVAFNSKLNTIAFQRAIRINSVQGYTVFANQFSESSQADSAITLRDSLAYEAALIGKSSTDGPRQTACLSPVLTSHIETSDVHAGPSAS